ncbi:MAG TPA: PIG-L deacetylase family protein [Gemmataceae bacterium]|nr:PIG-L deacetylase family protein [Gemmataceae bacterium]
MNVMVIAPHPDDEAIGCGGTICLHVGRGDRVAVVFLTSGELGLKHLPQEQARQVREREAEAAADVLGVAAVTFLRQADWYIHDEVDQAAAALTPVLGRAAPQIVYLPHPREWHPDHRAALFVVRAALAGADIPVPVLLTYEVWTPLAEYDRVEDITPVMMRKLRAIRCYRSQLEGFRYDRAARGLGQYRGALAGRCRYAEVFQPIDPAPLPSPP